MALVIYALGVQEVKKMDEMIFSQENLPKLKKHYKEICILWAEYKKIEQPALAEYEKIEQPAWAEYQRKKDEALEVFLEKIRMLIKDDTKKG